MTIQMKAIEQYFVQRSSKFKSVVLTLVCDHSSESFWAVLSCGTVYYAVQGRD